MAPEQDTDPRARDLANLRLEVNALSSKINTADLPAALAGVRRTIIWAAVAIAVALIVSGLFHLIGNSRVEQLERRVEQLEKYRSK